MLLLCRVAAEVPILMIFLQVSGNLTFTPTDAIAMLQLCSYETDALGYSAFCPLFTKQDFENYEYYYDLVSLHFSAVRKDDC